MNRIGFWWDIKTANIEYYDIQYAAERTINPTLEVFASKILKARSWIVSDPLRGQ